MLSPRSIVYFLSFPYYTFRPTPVCVYLHSLLLFILTIVCMTCGSPGGAGWGAGGGMGGGVAACCGDE